MNLIAHLQQVPEFRAARGQRYPLWLILTLIILGGMMGYWGYRPLAEFTQLYGAQLRQKLGLASDTALPSYSTFRRIMHQLDYQALATMFTQWAEQSQGVEAGEWFAADGKSIKGSMSAYAEAAQNFVSLVSLFSHRHGVVQAVMPMENKRVSEQEVVRLLLEKVGFTGIGVSLDALHCQKNTAANYQAG
jgi:hypothetical protein